MGGLIPNIFILWHTGQRETCGHWRRFRNQGALATESSSQRMYHRLHAQACLNEIDHSSKIDTYCTCCGGQAIATNASECTKLARRRLFSLATSQRSAIWRMRVSIVQMTTDNLPLFPPLPLHHVCEGRGGCCSTNSFSHLLHQTIMHFNTFHS